MRILGYEETQAKLERDPRYQHICKVMQHPNGWPFRFTEKIEFDDGTSVLPTECLTMCDEWRGLIADGLMFGIVELFPMPDTVTVTFALAAK